MSNTTNTQDLPLDYKHVPKVHLTVKPSGYIIRHDKNKKRKRILKHINQS